MDNSAITDTSIIAKLLTFWFDHEEGIARWFKQSASADAECKQWTSLVEAARQGKLTATWSKSPDGALALLILLDQLPRNLYRGTSQAFASDDQALSVALEAIAQGFDRQVGVQRQMFFYLPIAHQESMLAQVGCLGLSQGMLARAEAGTEFHRLLQGGVGMAQVRIDVIRRFGRFPGRNEALDRMSTPEELEFLKDKGYRGY